MIRKTKRKLCEQCGVPFQGRLDCPSRFCSRACYRLFIRENKKDPEIRRQKSIKRCRKWREENREHHREHCARYAKNRRLTDPVWWEQRKAIGRKRARAIRRETIMAYGGPICVCEHKNGQCGPKPFEHLALDHATGESRKNFPKRRGNALFPRLKKLGYPSGFRVLCHNCNCALGFYNYCPLSKEANLGIAT